MEFQWIYINYKTCRHTHRNEPFSAEKGHNASAKSIDPGQPAQSAQADLDRNFSLLANFLHIRGLFYIMTHLDVKTDGKMSKVKACMTFRSNIVHTKNPRMRRYA